MKDIENTEGELSHNINAQEEMAGVLGQLVKSMLEGILNAELDNHLGYAKNNRSSQRRKNNRNGYSPKILKSSYGDLMIHLPRDRNGLFKPMIVPKRKTHLDGSEDMILTLYAQGATVQQIQQIVKELYRGAKISTGFISNVTEAVIDKVRMWQNRPLESIYVEMYLDCIVFKVRKQEQVTSKSVYIVLGINRTGNTELLGLWVSEMESDKFWLEILTELQNRGVKDIFTCCVDEQKVFTEAIAAVYPKAKIRPLKDD